MSNHRPPTDPGPSVASIATLGGLTLAALGLVAYILWGPMDTRDLIGAGLGFVLGASLMAQTVFRYSEREAAKERTKRWEARQKRENVAPMVRPVFSDEDLSLPEELGPEDDRYPQYEPVAQVLGEPDLQPWASDETHVFRTGEADEDTRRLDYPARQVHGPSPAALRPIQVPVFRSEVERRAWADRYDLPTEVVPFQRFPEGWPEV
jgi:hypothetical protein